MLVDVVGTGPAPGGESAREDIVEGGILLMRGSIMEEVGNRAGVGGGGGGGAEFSGGRWFSSSAAGGRDWSGW